MVANIQTGTIANPYRQFTETIPAGQIRVIRYVHNSMTVLDNDQPDNLEVNFGGSGGFTKMDTGIIYEYPDGVSIPFVELRNTSDQTMHVTVSLAVGTVQDNRLNVSGTVNVQGQEETPVYVKEGVYTAATITTGTFDENGEYSFAAPATSKKVIIQNAGTNDIYLFNINGLLVTPTATFEMNFAGTISIYGTAGQTVKIGVFE